MMIRPATLSDRDAMTKLFSALSLFNTDELIFMSDLVDSYFNGTLGEGHYWIVGDDSTIVSAAYYAPESFGQNVYNLHL